VASNVTAIVSGDLNCLFLKNDGSLWGMGYNYYGHLGDGTYNNTNRPEQIVAAPPGYNQISGQLFGGSNMRISFIGNVGGNYALDRSVSLSPANWIPQVTNPADANGNLIFTNAPNSTTNNFWRIRSVP
jgi:alpha-tubulin suppressor-like RCC1 family protein